MTDSVQQDQPAGMNRHQVATLRQIAEDQINQALNDFAKQLPGGLTHLQAALNEAGAVLDRLMSATGTLDRPADLQSPTEANPDQAAQRLPLDQAADQASVNDVTSGA
jgi:enamine deaminase RidA (YjgF/YER057c/UK114 family)